MRKGLFFLCLLSFCAVAMAQKNVGKPLAARANVAAYDNEDAIVKLGYRESPYYQEITGSWEEKQTDSSRLYSRELDVEKYWKDYRVFLNVRCGRACRVMLNGKVVGYGDDSRHWNEFELNKFLKYGKRNILTIEALAQSEGALLESDLIEEGLNGEPYLLFKSDPNVADFLLTADYDAATAMGSLTLDATVFSSRKKGRCYLEVEIWDTKNHSFDRMGRWVVFDKKNEVTVDISRSWTDVLPWTAETPNLYTAVMRLRNEEMEELEVVGARFGFRRVEVEEGQLRVNGTAVTLKGITIAENASDAAASRHHLLSLVQNLKAHNINAVRTERLSPAAPMFYELCDEYGIYVVCDANLMPASSQRQAVATDKDYIPLFEQRVENLYGKYKNYTSIIAWSLGSSRDNGVCMGAAYSRLKAIEKNRPVVFAGADFTENTDIVAFLNPDQQQLGQGVAKAGDRPFLVLAAGMKGFGKVWDKVVNTRALQGVFYDGMPGPMMAELKNLYSPVDIQFSKRTIDDAEFAIFNRNDFVDFSKYQLEYIIYTNLRPNITAGDVPLAIRGGGMETVRLRVPPLEMQAGEELFIRFDLNRRQQPGVRPTSVGKELGTFAFPLMRKPVKKNLLDVGDRMLFATFDSIDGHVRCRVHAGASDVAFNLGDGTLEWLTAGMGSIPVNSLTLFFENHRDWKRSLVAIANTQPAPGVYAVDAMLRYHSREGNLMCDVRQTYTLFATGDVVVEYTVSPSDMVHETLVPRVEVAHSFGQTDSLSWFGFDRETPNGQNRSAIPGTYREALPHGMIRDANRWCALSDDNYKGLYIDVLDTTFSFMADTQKLWITPYISSPDKPSFRLHQRGFSPKAYNISSTFVNQEQFEQQTRRAERVEEFIGMTYPRVSTGMLEPPLIKASASRFAAPLKVSITSPSGGDIRYTLDGNDPDESSPLYNGPITLTTTTVVKARVFGKGVPPSFTASRKFNYDYIVSTTFSRKPNTPFNVGADTLLFDGEKGTADNLSYGWLGFSGTGVTTTVGLSKPIDIQSVTLRFAHVPDNWAFAPRAVDILLSRDGQTFSDTVRAVLPFDPSLVEENRPQVVEIKVPVGKDGIQAFKIATQALEKVPSWHRAKGLKPWLLMDEILVDEKLKIEK